MVETSGLREFKTAAEMMTFYRDLQDRMGSLQAPPPKPKPVDQSMPQPYPFVRLQLQYKPYPRTPMERILIAVSRHFGFRVSALRSPKRTADVVLARSVAYYLGRRLLNLTLPQLGKIVGRDHTSVLHGLRSVRRKLVEDPEFSDRIDKLITQVLEKD